MNINKWSPQESKGHDREIEHSFSHKLFTVNEQLVLDIVVDRFQVNFISDISSS